MKNAQIGLIGLAVMGANLARNIADKKIPIVVYNRSSEKTTDFIKNFGNEYLCGEMELKEFVEKIEKPRKIIVMVKAGDAVDMVISQLTPFLEKEDIVIDCGNSNFTDSRRRFNQLKEKGLGFLGCGVSGGEEGALHGPSIMPGGDKKYWQETEEILKAIAAKDFNGDPCVSYIGNNGAGHYVKMVHNGIEYGIMQIMAEAYDIFRTLYKLEAPEIAEIFERYNQGKLSSYLFEIAVEVLNKKDDSGDGYLIDMILDKAAQKGTGKWTAIDALERGVSLPTITEAVFSRYISSQKELREETDKIYGEKEYEPTVELDEFIEIFEDALYAAMLSCYSQGYFLIQTAAAEENWEIDLAEVSRIWQGGCIIRAQILKELAEAYMQSSNSNTHLLNLPLIKEHIKKTYNKLGDVVNIFSKSKVPFAALSSSLSYLYGITQKNSSANFIQGLRDYFGAHTYERIDKEGTFHTNWNL